MFSKKFNCKRHESSCPHKGDDSQETPQKVAGAPEKVAGAPEKVAGAPEKVALAPEKVAQAPEKVALAPEKIAGALEPELCDVSHTKVECDMCYKQFTSRWNLMHHMKTCKGVSHPHMCPKCRLVLSSKYAKSRHMKGCDGTGNDQALIVSPNHSIPTTLASTTLEHPPATALTNNNYVNAEQVTMNQQTNIQQNIIINSFGNEDLTRVLKPEYLDERLREFNGKGIFRIVKDVHMNPDTPENQNIRMGSKKSKTLKVYCDDGKWHIKANCDILEILISKYKSILTQRCFATDYKTKYESDLMQVQQDLLKFDKKTNCTAYYACAHKIIAMIEDLELHSTEEE